MLVAGDGAARQATAPNWSRRAFTAGASRRSLPPRGREAVVTAVITQSPPWKNPYETRPYRATPAPLWKKGRRQAWPDPEPDPYVHLKRSRLLNSGSRRPDYYKHDGGYLSSPLWLWGFYTTRGDRLRTPIRAGCAGPYPN